MSARAKALSDAPQGLASVAARAVETFNGPLPDEALHAAKRCLMDWLGVAMAGHAEQPVSILRSALARATGMPAARLGEAPFTAALLLGTASHALDYDDTDYINLIHVSSTLLPALFGLAGEVRPTGKALLKSFVAGFEAEDRIGSYLGRKLTAQGWHVSGVIGHVGSALSAGLLLSLPADRLVRSMAISGTAASGLIAAFGTMSKPLQLGRAAADGVMAALLARDGFTGPETLLESDPGLGRPFVAEAIADWSDIEASWGRPYAVLLNSFKPHASCMITHPIIDAAAAIRTQMTSAGRSGGEVARVVCRVNTLAPKVAGYLRPRTGLEGKFSVAYCCAMGLLHGRATPDCFADSVVAAADARDLVAKITVAPDATVGEQQAIVSAELGDGTVFAHETRMAKGNPNNPLTDAELEAKFLALAEPIAGSDARRLAGDIWRFDQVRDVAAWFGRIAVGV